MCTPLLSDPSVGSRSFEFGWMAESPAYHLMQSARLPTAMFVNPTGEFIEGKRRSDDDE